MAPPGSAFMQQQNVSSHHCFDGHTVSKQDFLLGAAQSHISAKGTRQAQRQLCCCSTSPQQDPQKDSDSHAGQILTPWDFKHRLMIIKRRTRKRYTPTPIMTYAAVGKPLSVLLLLGEGVGLRVEAMIEV